MLQPHIDTMEKGLKEGEKLSFKQVVQTAAMMSALPLQIPGICKFNDTDKSAFGAWGYCVFGCALSEVEVDVITGETTILYTKLLCDHGQSLNPMIDCGQAEGGFMQGVGFFLREKEVHNIDTGELLSD